MSSGRLQELKNNGKSLNFQAQKVVMVAHRRWKSFGVLDRWSLTCMGGGWIWKFNCSEADIQLS